MTPPAGEPVGDEVERAGDGPRRGVGPDARADPGGTLVVRDAPGADPLDLASAERIRAAFARGAGHGLLQLGAAEVDTTLPPGLAFWRDVGRAFVAGLCAQPELAASRQRLRVPFPEAEIAALAAGAPPMPGGEYLDAGALAAPWDVMNAACGAEIGAFDGPLEAYLQSRHPAWHVVGRVGFHLAGATRDRGGAPVRGLRDRPRGGAPRRPRPSVRTPGAIPLTAHAARRRRS